jgi:hypothetical protein
MLFRQIITDYSENYISTLCGQNEDLSNAEADVTYSLPRCFKELIQQLFKIV